MLMTIFTTAGMLFLVMDPLGNIPVVITLLKDIPPRRRLKIIARESCIALGMMTLFLFFGPYVLTFFGLSEPSLRIGGGIILFLLALKMIFPSQSGLFGDNPTGEPFIVPLATPLIAGPSTLTVVMLLTTREPHNWPTWLLALVGAWILSTIILLFSTGISKLLRVRGLIAMERLMGLILTTVSIEMLLGGIRVYVQSLK